MELRILIAEDNPINQQVAQLILKRAGYAVEAVGDGSQAVEACCLGTFHVVLMDWQMPEMDGLEATQRIRTLEKPQPIIIAVTAHALVGDREKCLQSGMDDYLSKPYRAKQLLDIIQKNSSRDMLADLPPQAKQSSLP